MSQQVEWHEVRVGDLGDVFTGRTPSTQQPEYFGEEFFFITPGDMHQGKHVTTTERGLSQAGAELLRRIQLPTKSVCVSCIGWQMGETVMTTGTSFTNQQINTIVPKSDVDADFLYYAFVPRKQQLLSLASAIGVRTPILNKSGFCDLRVLLPSLPTQRKIATILSAYDNLIDNNQRRTKILEKMVQKLYTEWFVKFRFPGYKKVKLVDSSLGRIPEGWKTSKLDDLVNHIRESTVPGDHLSDRLYVPIDCIPKHSLAILESEPWDNARSSLRLFDEMDILFGAMRPYFHKVAIAPFKGITRTTCFVLRPRDSEVFSYSVMTLFQEETIEFANKHSQGSTIPYVAWEGVLANMPCLEPPDHLLKTFNSAVYPILRLIHLQYFIQKNLCRARDLLLPRLISGELDVSDLDIKTGDDE